jgi:hypothetical protein
MLLAPGAKLVGDNPIVLSANPLNTSSVYKGAFFIISKVTIVLFRAIFWILVGCNKETKKL